MFASRSIRSFCKRAYPIHQKLFTHDAPVVQLARYFCLDVLGGTREKINREIFFKLAGIIGLGSSIAVYLNFRHTAEAKDATSDSVEDTTKEFGNRIPGMPEYTAKDVAEHDAVEKGIWISFKNGVYDITNFIKEHPGGELIMLGAGGSVEPFWALYAVHKNRYVLELLEKFRIGNLAEKDVGVDVINMEDPFANEPTRHPALRPKSVQPFNAESPPILLVEKLHTPNEMFYVRNHLPVPYIDMKDYEVEIEGEGFKVATLTLEDIKKFPKRTITATVMCGGNRRSDMAKVKSVKGLNWGTAAVGNAEWSGARLYDVLRAAGVEMDTKALHVQFEGYDLDTTGSPYGASIPIEKALDPKGDVLLAYEMNGEPLSRDHGYPVRVIVPGVVGSRSVKWLGRIIVSKEESMSFWQQKDYKTFGPNVDFDSVDFSKSPAIQEMPVTSAICSFEEGQVVKAKNGMIEVKGYSYSGGGRKTIRVDISADGGETWQQAQEIISDDAEHPHAWGWTLWKTQISVPQGQTKMQLVVKAVDSNHNTQPDNFANIWNFRGLLSNAYHRVNIEVKN